MIYSSATPSTQHIQPASSSLQKITGTDNDDDGGKKDDDNEIEEIVLTSEHQDEDIEVVTNLENPKDKHDSMTESVEEIDDDDDNNNSQQFPESAKVDEETDLIDEMDNAGLLTDTGNDFNPFKIDGAVSDKGNVGEYDFAHPNVVQQEHE